MMRSGMWYYSKNGMQMGPVSQEELSAKANLGEVLSSDLIWREGMQDWLPLTQVSEFQAIRVPAVPSGVGMVPVPMRQPSVYPVGSVPNYLWQSIVVTVLCCLPFGVVSIVHAAKVDSLLAQGDIVGATAASRSAKKWAIAGVASWGAIIALYLLFFLVMLLIGAASGGP